MRAARVFQPLKRNRLRWSEVGWVPVGVVQHNRIANLYRKIFTLPVATGALSFVQATQRRERQTIVPSESNGLFSVGGVGVLHSLFL